VSLLGLYPRDMRRNLTLIRHADDYTLMAPFGGEPTRGFDASSERLEAIERYFQAGEADVELVQSYASGDIVVLVVIERQLAGSAVCRTKTGRCA